MKRKKHNVPTVDNIIGNFAGRPVRVIIVVVSLIAIIFPLYWLLTSSVKIEAEYLSNPPLNSRQQVIRKFLEKISCG